MRSVSWKLTGFRGPDRNPSLPRGGNGRSDVAPRPNLVPRRVVPEPRRRNWSNSGRSGTARDGLRGAVDTDVPAKAAVGTQRSWSRHAFTHLPAQITDEACKFGEWHRRRALTSHHQIRSDRQAPPSFLAEEVTQATTELIPMNGIADGPANRERHTGRGKRCGCHVRRGKSNEDRSVRPKSTTLCGQTTERCSVADGPDQADSLARPFARRAFKMARPARVDIRRRKPCFLDRFRLFG
jgi:hypothetical protein